MKSILLFLIFETLLVSAYHNNGTIWSLPRRQYVESSNSLQVRDPKILDSLLPEHQHLQKRKNLSPPRRPPQSPNNPLGDNLPLDRPRRHVTAELLRAAAESVRAHAANFVPQQIPEQDMPQDRSRPALAGPPPSQSYTRRNKRRAIQYSDYLISSLYKRGRPFVPASSNGDTSSTASFADILAPGRTPAAQQRDSLPESRDPRRGIVHRTTNPNEHLDANEQRLRALAQSVYSQHQARRQSQQESSHRSQSPSQARLQRTIQRPGSGPRFGTESSS